MSSAALSSIITVSCFKEYHPKEKTKTQKQNNIISDVGMLKEQCIIIGSKVLKARVMVEQN